MNKAVKCLIPASLFLLSTVALIGSEIAQCPTDCPKPEAKPCPPKPACPPPKPACPPKPDCCKMGNCAKMDHTRGPCREITPNAGPCVADGVDAILSADFIYWMAKQDHLAYAYTTGTTALSGGGSSIPAQGKVHAPNPGFKPGFKVGLGIDLDHDGWDLFAEYTWFQSSQSNNNGDTSTGVASNQFLLTDFWSINGSPQSTVGGSTPSPVFTSASGRWKLNMNVVDLELGRNFYISRQLMLRPHVGMKGTWDRQRYNVAYNNATTVLSMKQRDTIQGYGIRGGLDTAWHFSRTFSFYGDFALTGLWEQFKVKRYDNSLAVLTSVNTSNRNVKFNYNAVRPIIEWAAGLKWENWWCADQYHVAISAGWEQQIWGDQNQFISFSSAQSRNGDLSLQGLDVKVRFDF